MKMKWWRALAACLAVVCLIGTVGALSFDLNGDGKTNVWDLQLAINGNKNSAGAVEEILGGYGDELHPNADGVYEIYSPLGLHNMAKMILEDKDAGVVFKLMRDIDMKGSKWYGNLIFSGTLEGNGHVICNLYVNDDTVINSSTGLTAQGFFAKLVRTGKVSDLRLENITMEIQADSTPSFVGLLAGTVVGEIHDCTTVGNVIDHRTSISGTCYIGTLAGRIDNIPDNPVTGITVDNENILMTAESAEVTAISGKSQKVLCKMGMDFAELTEGTRQLGITGVGGQNATVKSYTWQDISGATTVVGGTGKIYNMEDAVLTQRRQAVVDKMYEICTIEWTPSKTMTTLYYKVGTGDNAGKLNFDTKIWEQGKVYKGMPYNHGSGSLERFEAWMDVGSNGRLTTKSTLPTLATYYTYGDIRTAMTNNGANATYADPNYSFGTTTTLKYIAAGYLKYEGTTPVYDLSLGYNTDKVGDQPMIVGEEVKSADHAGFSRYVGNDCSQAIQWAWREVVSSDVASGGTVISGVGQMAPLASYQTRYGVLPVGNLVPTGTAVATWEEYCAAQGETKFFEAYAQASKGDGLIMFATAGGHSRMIAYDPICIRNYKGVIDEKNSYIITHEQGRGSSGTDNGVAWSSSCYANCMYTFDQLYNYKDYTSGIGSRGYYMPMTLPAFHDVDNAAVTSNVTYKSGVVKSNFFILSTTVDGNEVFTAVGQHQTTNSTTRVGSGYRDAHVQEDVAKTHGDLTGKTITVRLSNGEIYTVNADTGAVTKN